jgi:CHAT domain-containing protein/Tfp pilus assembly protein PilF
MNSLRTGKFFLVAGLALALPRPALGQGLDENSVINQFNGGTNLLNRGNSQEAAATFRRLLPAAEALWGPTSERTLLVVTNLSMAYYNLGRYAEAEPLMLRSLRGREARLGKNHPDVAQSLYNLANLYDDWGLYSRAEPLFQRGIAIREALTGGNDTLTITYRMDQAALYWHMGQGARAEAIFNACLRTLEARLGKDDVLVGRCLQNLAVLYEERRQYPRAELSFQRALRTFEARFGKDHPQVAVVLHNLAGLYLNMGQYAKAEAAFRRSLQIRLARLGRDHPDVADTLMDLGGVYRDQGQKDKAEPLFRRALSIFETRLGPDHPRVALALQNLGNLYQEQGQFTKAEELLSRSRRIYEGKFGKDSYEAGGSLLNLARVSRDLGQPDQAEALLRRSLAIWKARLPRDHPHLALCLGNLADCAAAQGAWERAVGYFRQGRRIAARHLAATLSALTDEEQLALLGRSFQRPLHLALSLGLAAPQEAGAASAEWLLNGQALAQQGLAEQQILTREARDPGARKLVEDLRQTRARLAALINRQPKPGAEAEHRNEVQALRAREQAQARDLARAVGRPYRADPWVRLDELRTRLGPKAAFVDIARFPVFDFRANKWQPARYAAWVTPPTGKDPVRLIDLGDADAIDRLVEKMRQSMIASARNLTQVGEVEASKALQQPLRELSAKVLHPVLPALAGSEEWVVCPDGALWLVPWSALLLPDGKFAVEQHLIRHVVSGRDLVQPLPEAKAAGAFLFADPDYDLAPGKVQAAAGQVRGLAGGLAGQRWPGRIGAKDYSFEFGAQEVRIYGADGALAGQGTWQEQGERLTIQTRRARFEGTRAGDAVRGQRSRRAKDGTVTLDPFTLEPPKAVRSGGLGTLPKVPRLPGTAAEAAAVQPQLAKWLGREPTVYLQARASEAVLRAVRHPRLLALATHGYFLPAQEVQPKDRPGLDEGHRSAAPVDSKGRPLENPLLRCGLLLAGCNQRGQARSGEDDGIVTGLEVVGLDLRGCELVVLSACETGLGEVRSGEGVAGLRQAFQLAGARGVLASLWQVPDRDTALLMQAFYSELAQGRTQAEALRQAQLQRLAARRQQFGAAHPFFWAAFALTNRGAE